MVGDPAVRQPPDEEAPEAGTSPSLGIKTPDPATGEAGEEAEAALKPTDNIEWST